MKSSGFEQDLNRLEEIVGRLESGELPLEEGVTAFEEGIKLSRACQKQLDIAEKRMEELMEDALSAPDEGG